MTKAVYEKVIGGGYLSYSELQDFVDNMRGGKINDLEFVTFLTAMETRNQIKGINEKECSNFIKALRIKVNSTLEGILCNASTGGDRVKTCNIGTPAAIVMASAGIKVLKIGSKGITSNSGSRDVLEAWGINTLKSIQKTIDSVKSTNIGYYDFSNLVPIKSRSGFRSPLHYLGPLCNPVKLKYKILGCVKKDHFDMIHPILKRTCPNYILSLNQDMDEISLSGRTLIRQRRKGVESEYVFVPKKEGFPFVGYNEITHPGDPKKGAKLIKEAISGKEGPLQNVIALNAGVGIYLTEMTNSIKEGYSLAKELINGGKAKEKLNEWLRFQNE